MLALDFGDKWLGHRGSEVVLGEGLLCPSGVLQAASKALEATHLPPGTELQSQEVSEAQKLPRSDGIYGH